MMIAPIAAMVGLTASGLVTGLTLAYPLLVNPHFMEQQGTKISPQAAQTANLSVAQRLTLWNRAYSLGAACIPALDAVSAVSFITLVQSGGTAAIKVRAAASTPRIASTAYSVDTMIYAAACCFLFHVPFTLLVIKPVNDQLMALRKKANVGEAVDEKNVDQLLSRWTTLHAVRIAAAMTGFLTALYAMVPV